jgi:hypothetical protein
MKETPQQYTERILSYVEGKQPLVVQAATAKKLNRLIRAYQPPNYASVPLRTNGQCLRSSRIWPTPKSSSAFRLRFILGPPGARSTGITPMFDYKQDTIRPGMSRRRRRNVRGARNR